MTQGEFRAYVKSVTGYDELPEGVSAEFVNGNLTFKKDGKKINLSEVRELSANEQTERERQE
jgi:hypothetical protein